MSKFCKCNFEAAMGHPDFEHTRGEPGFFCKYDPTSPEYTGSEKIKFGEIPKAAPGFPQDES